MGKFAARRGILLALEVADTENQPRDAVVLVGLNYAFGKFHCLVNIAIHEEGQEGAIEQLAVVWIPLESRPVIGGRSPGVALLARMTGGKVTARRRRVG